MPYIALGALLFSLGSAAVGAQDEKAADKDANTRRHRGYRKPSRAIFECDKEGRLTGLSWKAKA